MTKLAIIGNCQARPLAKILTACTEATVSDIFIIHLEKTDKSDQFWEALDASDYVLTQLTNDNYPCPHVRSSKIKRRYSEKVFVWPNLFHSGQQPLLRYITNINNGRILGPLDAYHNINTFNQWRQNRRLEGLVVLPEFKVIEDCSTASLKSRELFCDVKMSDFITRHLTHQKLFFTFNHPTMFLLTELAKRCAKLLKLEFNQSFLPTGEPLGSISPPSPFTDHDKQEYLGREIIFSNEGNILMGNPKTYNQEELLKKYFISYDQQINQLSDFTNLRFTPNYNT